MKKVADKTKSAQRGATAKTVDEYLAAVPQTRGPVSKASQDDQSCCPKPRN